MILIVDDDKTIRLTLSLLLKRAGYDCDSAENPAEALSKVRTTEYSLILMDMNYGREVSGTEGIELLRKCRIFQPETPVILITAWGSIDLAVEGMKSGATDFITKPWDNRLLLQRIDTAIKMKAPANPQPESGFRRDGIIGNNPQLLELLGMVERVAPTEAPVLILGENGTGKELIANCIHINSPRRQNPFVMVNLGGISSSLFESEMFGHTKGAFTGAVAARKGRFEMADKGTIFLDEIGDLDAANQVKLLRVLQQHTFEPLGDSRPRKVDIRVVAATNADIPTMVENGDFREDLYYRINLVTLRLPALRERRDDIPLLARHFVKMAAKERPGGIPEISSDAMEWLTRLPFPGNIRQLKNIVERAVILGGDILRKEDFELIADVAGVAKERPAGTLSDLERQTVADALLKSGGNMALAARILGITRQTLYRRMEKYGLK